MIETQLTEHESPPEEKSVAIPAESVAGFPSNRLSEKLARLWALVLDSRAVPCHLEQDGGSWRLMVPSARLNSAINELRCFVEENRNWPPTPPAHPLSENSLATLSVLLLLATFYNITHLDLSLSGGYPPDWITLGNANPTAIMKGEWWRLVTALTLHADLLHLVSNLAIGGVFIFFLCRELGSGLAWSLILGSGILGNLVNSLLQAPDHRSVGSSTALFGTVGILAAVSMFRSPGYFMKRRLLLPTAAALALLTILGTEGKQTDLGAHFFGFVSGMALGLSTELLVSVNGRPGRILNILLALLSILVVVWSWCCALGMASRIRILLLLLFLPSIAFSFQNEPDGFREIPWGSPVGKIAGLRPAAGAEGTVRSYTKMDEIFDYEGVILSEILYLADQERFVGVELTYRCAQRGEMLELLTDMYEEATRTARGGTLYWQGRVTTVTLAPPDAIQPWKPSPLEPSLCSLTFRSTPSFGKNAPQLKVK